MSQETKTNSNRKRNIIIVAVSLIVIIAVGAGVWAYQSFNGSSSSNGYTIPTLPGTTGQTVATSGDPGRSGTSPAKLTISLGPGQAQPDNPVANPVVDGVPLDDATLNQILDRLPELTGEEGDVQEYNLPDDLLPPPLTGDTIEEPFPPPPTQYEAPEVVEHRDHTIPGGVATRYSSATNSVHGCWACSRSPPASRIRMHDWWGMPSLRFRSK